MLIMQEQLRASGVNIDLKIIDHTAYHADNRKDLNTLAMQLVELSADADSTSSTTMRSRRPR